MSLVHRPRRLRRTSSVRALVSETRLSPGDLVSPMFVVFGRGKHEEIPSMPGVARWSVDRLAGEAQVVVDVGIPAVMLFGIPESKDPGGSGAFADDGVVQQAVRALRRQVPELVIMTDVCLCEYTDHGHCGLVSGSAPDLRHPNLPDGTVLNDETLQVLGKIAVSHATAGADMVAPSGMMDGMVGVIRRALDDAGQEGVGILSYAAKYASAFYGPFREAARGTPQSGDRRSHQMDPANAREALREVALDLDQGADIVMVKPALAYLDVIRRVRDEFADVPVAAYNVSGEYSMVKAAAERGWLDERATVMEVLTGIKRAGADLIITYHAKAAAQWCRET